MTKQRRKGGPQLPKQRPGPTARAAASGDPRPGGPELRRGADPEVARRLANEGAHLLAAKQPAEAAVFLARAWELAPHDAVNAINLGGAYILQGKYRLAVPILEAAARLEPDNPMVWTNLAAAYLGKLPLAGPKEQELAIAAYTRVLALNPRTPHVHYNLGLIYLERQELAQAAACFHDALNVDPDDRDARLWLERIEHS